MPRVTECAKPAASQPASQETLTDYSSTAYRSKNQVNVLKFATHRSLLSRSQVLRPYQLPVVPLKGEEHRRDAACAILSRLTLTLLVLEPGQAVAAQGQLALALETIGARTLQNNGDDGG